MKSTVKLYSDSLEQIASLKSIIQYYSDNKKFNVLNKEGDIFKGEVIGKVNITYIQASLIPFFQLKENSLR